MTIIWKYILGFLGLVTLTVWLVFASSGQANLQIIACDVGQGDAILIQQNNSQILVDGGKGNKVLDCLSNHMPFWDRQIELIVLTHPQLDHYGGFIEVVRRYTIETFLTSGLDSQAKAFQELKEEVNNSQAKVLRPGDNMILRVGDIQLDIIWPSQSFLANNQKNRESLSENVLGLTSFESSRDPNDFSIVVNLNYGEFDAVLTGDIGPGIIDEVLAQGMISDIEYLKVPHHGSKNGLTPDLLNASTPEVAVISSGENPWGHPHEEVLKLLSEKNIKILRTDKEGEVIVETDGEKWWINN